MARLASLWRNLVRRRRVERDLEEELRATFELLVEEKVRVRRRRVFDLLSALGPDVVPEATR